MQSVYLAANITDAYLVRDLLQQSDIAAFVRGENLQGGMGEIPVTSGIDVCVDAADVDTAREVLAQWKRGDFALEPDAEEPVATAVEPTRRWLSLPLALFIGGVCGAALVWFTLSGPVETGQPVDYDEDGIVDDTPYFSGDALVRVETDRNQDGKPDMVTYYDGQPADRAESDDDFDGRMETRHRYLRNNWLDTEADLDGDGGVDHRIEANAGVIAREQWLDFQGKVVKQVLYRNGQAKTRELDRDGDGHFEVRTELDAMAEPVSASSGR